MTLKIVTANRLTDGAAVWLGQNAQWVDSVAEARAERTEQGHADLEADARHGIQSALVVDAALIDAEWDGGAPRPTKLKERIRALGPTVRLDLGKQAVSSHAPERAA